MAVLTNTMMQGTAAVSDDTDEAYQIEKSVMFDDASESNLQATFGLINKRKFTVSVWFKKSEKGEDINFLGNVDTTSWNTGWVFFVDAGEQITFYNDAPDGSAINMKKKTNAVLRDPNAWYHAVLAVDTGDPVADDRIKIYLNGRRITSFAESTNPGQYDEVDHGDADQPYNLGYQFAYSCGQMADPQFLDGIALSAAAFGQYDSAGNWNPKALSLPGHNKNTTWNTGSTNCTNPANAFDGSAGTYAEANSAGAKATITIPATTAQEVRMHISSSTAGYVYINGNEVNSWSSNPSGWVNCPWDGTAITSIGFESASQATCYRVEFDGVVLKSSSTDPTVFNNQNQGVTWDSFLTFGHARQGTGQCFDGTDNYDYSQPGSSGTTAERTVTFAPTTPIKIEETLDWYYDHSDQGWEGGTYVFTIDGVSKSLAANATNDDQWLHFTEFAGKTISNTTPLTVVMSGGDYLYWIGLGVDGTELRDGVENNSFNLKFNDTSSDRNLGYSKVMNTCTGAQPMYGSGADDSAKANIKLAIPGYDLADHSHTIKGSGSAQTLTNTNTTNVEQGGLYNDALYFNDSAKLVTAVSTDYELGTSDFTVECWIKGISNAGADVYIQASDGDDDYSPLFNYHTDANGNQVNCYIGTTGSSYDICSGNTGNASTSGHFGTQKNGVWTHYAVVRNGSSFKGYENGVEKWSVTNSGSVYQQHNQFCLGNGQSGNFCKGYMQDFRYYKSAKYTSAFVPPKRLGFSVNNISIPGKPAGYQGINHAVNDNTSNWNYTNSNADAASWTGTLAEVASGGFWGTDKIFWVDLGQQRTMRRFVWNLTSDGTSTAGTTAFIMFHSNDPSSNGDTRCSGGCTVNVANTFSGSMGGDMTVTHDLGSGNTITKRYIGLSNGSGSSSTHFKCTSYSFSAHDGSNWTPPLLKKGVSVDSRTNYLPEEGNDALGGVTRGNYCTWSDNARSGTLTAITTSHGNLSVYQGENSTIKGTFLMTAGKWYFEWTLGNSTTGHLQQIGIIDSNGMQDGSAPGGADHNGYIMLTGWSGSGNVARLYHNGTASITNWPDARVEGDVISVAYDADTGKLWFAKNGTWLNDSSGNTGNPAAGTYPAITVSATYRNRMVPVCGSGGGGDLCHGDANFGQHAFKYTAPTDFKTLCTQNLPDTFSGTELNNPSKYVDTKLWSGDGVDGKGVRGFNFGPDFLWMKSRNTEISFILQDIIRGVGNTLDSDNNDAAGTGTGYVESFESDGFDLEGSGGGNTDTRTYVGHGWDAGTTNSGANEDGSTNVSSGNQWVNATAGFSITKYAGTGANASVGHGLSTAPEMVIIKNLDDSTNWEMYHIGLGADRSINLSDGAAMSGSDGGYWNNASPDNTVFNLSTSTSNNGSGDDYIAYCWAPIPGFSAFGSYLANNSTDGPIINVGFRPQIILLKNNQRCSWILTDDVRNKENTTSEPALMHPNNAAHEGQMGSGKLLEFLSNGFKIRSTNCNINYTNTTDKIIYAAWARSPFKTARAF